ncbi:pentapeptide repeat-containing protein [Cryptosporangium phraense]|uniref:Pentapeptide repeat-containing protein n=1 Tax=Cryptosporangium phraense TaxID=2593070 RepID=A0A545AYV3_9ACTN|nr:pentapeptide repeat-containing protein [Cryptosporangium phraense]TQS46474.1 pentapeptide repeat-containing protein [Cryptosporangium phraense]
MPPTGTVPRAPQIEPDDLEPADSALDDEIDLYRNRVTGSYVGAAGRGEIAQVHADGADFTGTKFEPIDLSDVRIERSDLAGARWEGASARRVEISDSRLMGFRLIATFVEDVLITGCRWDDGGLYVRRGKGSVVFRDCTFSGTTLRGDLSGVVFDGCDLNGAEFGADAARKCDLRTSRMMGARGLTTLRGAIITPDQALSIADLLAAELGFTLA